MTTTPRRHRRLLPTLLSLLLATALAACANNSSGGGGSGDGVTVQVAQYSWTAAEVTNAILTEIVAGHPELGVGELVFTDLDLAPAWTGARQGDIDVLTEVAMPNQQPFADKSKDEVAMLHETYGGAAQGWFVPTYAVQPGGPLEGLTSVTQLDDYAEELGGRLLDADPGWKTTEQNAKRLQGYGLELEHATSSESAYLAELERAYAAKEPVVVYLYRPHWVFSEYDMTQLEEPTPYTDGCFTTGDGACAMPDYSAWTAARKDLKEEAPAFYALLERFELPLEDLEGMLAKVDLEEQPAADVAAAWVEDNAGTIDGWVKASS